MKIVAFLNAYTQGKSGGDVCFVETYKRLKHIELTVVTSKLGRQFCRKSGLKANYLITTSENRFSNVVLTYLVRTWKGMNLIASINRADISYSTSDALPDVLPAVLLSTRLNIKWIGNIFHLIPSSRFVSYFSQTISHFILKSKSDHVFVDNKLLQNELINKGFNKSKISIRYPGINFEKIRKAKSINTYDVVTMLRIHPAKGIYDVIDIWKPVSKQFPRKTLGIIGTGDTKYLDTLQLLIDNNKLQNNIFLTGYVTDDEAFAIIKGGRLFIFPSHEEGFGMAVGEALACGTPVIAYNLPAYTHSFKPFINTVECYNKEQFAEKVITYLKKPNNFTIDISKLDQFSWKRAVKEEKKHL